VYSGKGGRVGAGLSSTSPGDCIFLLEAVKNCVSPKGGRVHGGIKGQLEVLMVVAKSIEEKDNLDLIKINRAHVGDPHVHGENLVGAIAEGGIAAIVEVKSLLE